MKNIKLLLGIILLMPSLSKAQLGIAKEKFTRADTLRGSLTPLRTCYDINYYHLDVIFTPFLFKHIKGQFVASFHFSPDHFNDNQESFRITYDLGRKIVARFKDDR